MILEENKEKTGKNCNMFSAENSLLDFETCLQAVHGKLIDFAHVQKKFCFTNVSIDSRTVVKDSLFVPLVGAKQNGHNFIMSALKNGAGVIFINQSEYEAHTHQYMDLVAAYPAAAFIVVFNTLTALQNAAAAYVDKFPDLIKIGITGSSGKTTTKEIAAAILSQKYKVITNEGNLNSETGLPLSVFKINAHHQIGLFEMGMNRVNEIGEIASVLKPHIAAITNIGSAHIGILGSRQAIAAEKKKIFMYLGKEGTAIIPQGDDFSSFLSGGLDSRIIYYGTECQNDIVYMQDLGLDGTEFTVDGEKMILPLPGVYNYLNAQAAIMLAKVLGLTTAEIRAGIESVKPLFGRSQIIRGSYTLIQDCYNANPDSMEKALDFFSSIKSSGKKICVLGDMLELGTDSVEAHKKAGMDAAGCHADFLFFVGRDMKYAADTAKQVTGHSQIYWFESADDASIAAISDIIKKVVRDGDLLFFKASRGIGLERIVLNIQEENKNG